ncbi:MAG: isoprenylcysteine carboxylmethyltransferase family protein [Alphaproteobacteria bacterium]|nr:isoprenylcysteine carboxylmethyltransferase family protein [Alphaproteobacteria bacterium]MCD8525769.1 isoprenylcysteine carboxylmethyltransferase family protein [Alphaproteobacteria bacterium]
MNIIEKLAHQGNFLFRWRSFLPLFFIIPGFFAISESVLIEEKYGDFLEEIWVYFSFIVSLCGLAIRWVSVGYVPAGTSGRNTKMQRANYLNTTGLYSVVKNPLYLGNFIAMLGVVMSLKVWWLVALGSLTYWIYIERVIVAEEKFLTTKFGQRYIEWAARTPIFIPDFRLWRAPVMPFSFKTVLRREYNGLMAVCSAFFLMEVMVDVFVEREPVIYWLREDWPWAIMMMTGSTLFFGLRFLKKNTRMLHVAGR